MRHTKNSIKAKALIRKIEQEIGEIGVGIMMAYLHKTAEEVTQALDEHPQEFMHGIIHPNLIRAVMAKVLEEQGGKAFE
jgi:hypothetical protein